jgi:hypothetical protein
VKNRFQSLPFKCNLQRYTAGRKVHHFFAMQKEKAAAVKEAGGALAAAAAGMPLGYAVGLCTLESS